LGPSSYAIIANLELVTVVALGVALLGEPVTPERAGGGALIIIGIVGYGLRRRPADAPVATPAEPAAERLRAEKAYQPFPALCGLQEAAQHVLQDAAVAEVFDLVERVDPADQRFAMGRAVGPVDRQGQLHARPEPARDTGDVERLGAGQPEA